MLGLFEGQDHVVVMDNFFTFINLLVKLTTKNIYAIDTL